MRGDADDYHEYLVSNWCGAIAGADWVGPAILPDTRRFSRAVGQGPLRAMSSVLLEMGRLRSGDWGQMQPVLMEMMGEDAGSVMMAAANAAPHFEEFFAGFARAGR
jgi:hypothetical protein